jgi:hypothetical protein
MIRQLNYRRKKREFWQELEGPARGRTKKVGWRKSPVDLLNLRSKLGSHSGGNRRQCK